MGDALKGHGLADDLEMVRSGFGLVVVRFGAKPSVEGIFCLEALSVQTSVFRTGFRSFRKPCLTVRVSSVCRC